MFGKKPNPLESKHPGQDEPRPFGVRILELAPVERLEIARYRISALAEHLRAARCAVELDSDMSRIDFHTGEHLLSLHVHQFDPRQIKLILAYGRNEDEYDRARQACFDAMSRQFASKALIQKEALGYTVIFTVAVYAESLSAFGDSLKSYVEDVIRCYDAWLSLMVHGDICPSPA